MAKLETLYFNFVASGTSPSDCFNGDKLHDFTKECERRKIKLEAEFTDFDDGYEHLNIDTPWIVE